MIDGLLNSHLQYFPEGGRSFIGNSAIGQGILHASHLAYVEQRLGPIRSNQDAALLLSGMPHPNLVIDIRIWDGQLGNDQVRDRKPFDHGLDYQSACILVRPDRNMLQAVLNHWAKDLVP